MNSLIVGAAGQDGTLLSKHLKESGHTVTALNNDGKVKLSSYSDVSSLLQTHNFDHVYYLAAYHHSSEAIGGVSIDTSIEVNHTGVLNFLEGIKNTSTKTKLFFASSSHIFGKSNGDPLREDSMKNPICIYGTMKLLSMESVKLYREQFGVFASVGILFNHESVLRKDNFLTKKIINTAKQISLGKHTKLSLGNIDQKVDWGFAVDYVKAFPRILNAPVPSDYVVSSGHLHTVREFVQIVFNYFNLNYQDYITEDKSVLTGVNRGTLFGDNKKIQELGWEPETPFEVWVQKICEEVKNEKN